MSLMSLSIGGEEFGLTFGSIGVLPLLLSLIGTLMAGGGTMGVDLTTRVRKTVNKRELI